MIPGFQIFNGSLTGIEVIVSEHTPCKREWRQVRFPRSKKKRIRKKWAKNKRRNWRMVEAEPYIAMMPRQPALFGNGWTQEKIICNRLGFAQLQETINGTLADRPIPRR